MNTGEHVAVDDNTRVAIPLRWIVAGVVACVALGGNIYKFIQFEDRLSRQDTEISTTKAEVAALRLTVNGFAKDIEYIKAGVDKIERKIDRMTRNREE